MGNYAREHFKRLRNRKRGFITFCAWGRFQGCGEVLSAFLKKWHSLIDWQGEEEKLRGSFAVALIRTGRIWSLSNVISYGCPFTRRDFYDLVGYAKEVIHEDHFGNYTAVVEKIFCRDLGDLNWIGAPQWLNRVCTDYKQRRIGCQNAVFFVICWLSRYYTKDVVQLVARAVWATRHSEDWNRRVLFSRLKDLL